MQASRFQTDRPPVAVSLGDIALERWRRGDLEPLFAAISANLDHLRPWMAFAAHHRRDSVAQFLTDSESGWERGTRFEYAIRCGETGLVGSAGLMSRIRPGGLEIGYWIDARHTHRGIATLAAAALSEMGLALSTVDHVEIHHNEANIASGGIPARLGFRNLGRFPAESKAPAEVGREVHWRLDAAQFDMSPAKSILDSVRGITASTQRGPARPSTE
jgi:ribosomal-protein-serine acetyltransferase